MNLHMDVQRGTGAHGAYWGLMPETGESEKGLWVTVNP